MGYWTHLVQTHRDISSDERLAEMLRTADLWRSYWANHSDGGKGTNLTMMKFDQMQDPAFGWQDVLAWDLYY